MFINFETASVVTMSTVRMFSFLPTNPNMDHVCHVRGAGKWLDEAVGGGGMQEDSEEGGQENRKV